MYFKIPSPLKVLILHVNLFIYITRVLLDCLKLLLVSSNLRRQKIVCNLEVLHCNCTKANLEYLVILVCTYQNRGLSVYTRTRLFRCNAKSNEHMTKCDIRALTQPAGTALLALVTHAVSGFLSWINCIWMLCISEATKTVIPVFWLSS